VFVLSFRMTFPGIHH